LIDGFTEYQQKNSLSNSYYNTAQIALNAIFRYYTEVEKFVGIPERALPIKPLTKKANKNILTKQEIITLFTEVEGQPSYYPFTNWNAKAFFALLAFTGMRKGEALALRWEDIDFLNGTIEIQRNLRANVVKNGVYEEGNTKNGKPRTALLSKNLSVILQKHAILRESDNPVDFSLEDIEAIENYDTKVLSTDDSFVISIDGKTPYSFTTPWNWFIAVCQEMKIDYKKRHLNVHSLRHTYTTEMLSAGFNPKLLQETMGHGREGIQDIYKHFDKGHLLANADKIDETFLALTDTEEIDRRSSQNKSSVDYERALKAYRRDLEAVLAREQVLLSEKRELLEAMKNYGELKEKLNIAEREKKLFMEALSLVLSGKTELGFLQLPWFNETTNSIYTEELKDEIEEAGIDIEKFPILIDSDEEIYPDYSDLTPT